MRQASAVRAVFFVPAVVVAAYLLAITLVGPSMLFGPWAGIPVTAGVFVAAWFGVRAVVRARRGPAERQQRAEAEQRARLQKWARKLRLARIARPYRSTYREAVEEMSGLGFLLGLGVGWILFAVIQVWSPWMGVAVMAGTAVLGVVVAIEYDVHLEEWWRKRRRRRLTRRLTASGGPAGVTGADLTALIDAHDPDFGTDHGYMGDHDSGCGSGCGSGD